MLSVRASLLLTVMLTSLPAVAQDQPPVAPPADAAPPSTEPAPSPAAEPVPAAEPAPEPAPTPAAEPAPVPKPNPIMARVDGFKTRGQKFLDAQGGKTVEGEGSRPWDVTGLFAGLIPRAYRAWTLVGLDLVLPLLLAVPVAAVGALAGAYAMTQFLTLTSKRDIPVYSPEALSGAALGSVAAGGLMLFLGDLVLNTFHLKWLITARAVGMAVLAVGAGALTVGLLVLAPLGASFNPIIPLLILVGGTVALAAFFVALVPVALGVSVVLRLLADEEFGSPMWQPGGRTGLE